MSSEPSPNSPSNLPRILAIVGNVAMLIGAIDPMEGSLLILPGSGLVALGTYLAHREQKEMRIHLWAFVLVALGVGALWSLSSAGGVGGSSALSAWWVVLIIPYPVGWVMGIMGSASPRWVVAGGIAVALWYLVIAAMVLLRKSGGSDSMSQLPGIAIGLYGLIIIVLGADRLRRWKVRAAV